MDRPSVRANKIFHTNNGQKWCKSQEESPTILKQCRVKCRNKRTNIRKISGCGKWIHLFQVTSNVWLSFNKQIESLVCFVKRMRQFFQIQTEDHKEKRKGSENLAHTPQISFLVFCLWSISYSTADTINTSFFFQKSLLRNKLWRPECPQRIWQDVCKMALTIMQIAFLQLYISQKLDLFRF